MSALAVKIPVTPELRVQVCEQGQTALPGWRRCEVDRDLVFSPEHLESYCLSNASVVGFDLLVLAAAVEYCDKSQHRPEFTWRRQFFLQVPVHELGRWNRPEVVSALEETLDLLTGDWWSVSFVARRKALWGTGQQTLDLPKGAQAVIPYSEGLDSRAVSALLDRELGQGLIRVRMHASPGGKKKRAERFAAVPYKVAAASAESSVRSRGFKFAMIGGLAAHLLGVETVYLPESGQGALGPALITVGQTYPDYRNHPRFLHLAEKFLNALLGHKIRFELPRLWFTKGQTVARYAQEYGASASWAATRSCWRRQRQVSVAGKWRQCGVCAACQLRRLSLHAAGLSEAADIYVWRDLDAPTLAGAADPEFKGAKAGKASREYAIAGVLHLHHLAGFRTQDRYRPARNLAVAHLAEALGESEAEIRIKLYRMLETHEAEWEAYIGSLAPGSFVRKMLAGGVR